ncbi:MAG: AI-2E family transporter [Ruminococcaceae bacterium]|nr:AI-2E family transporter [Oscillospiraceae bacterium]
MELNSKNIKRILFIIFCSAIIFAAVLNAGRVFGVVSNVFSLFAPIIAALCIAFVLNVLLTALETKVFFFFDKAKKKFVRKLKRPLCLILTYLIGFGLISLLILVIIPDIVDTVTYLIEKMPGFIADATNWLQSFLGKFDIEIEALPGTNVNWTVVANTVKNWFSGSEAQIVGDAVNITTSLFSGVFDTVFSLVISVYILAQKERIGAFVKRTLDAFLPQKTTNIIYHISSQTAYTFSRFIGGQLTEALILGLLCYIGMLIFGFPNALIISVLIAVTSLVPVVGATIGVVIGALLIFITDPLKALLFVIFFLVLQQVEGNLIYPKVVGKAVGLPGVLVVSAVLIGGNIGGVMGTLLAVPTCATLYVFLKEAVDYFQKKKALKNEITE